MHHFFKIIFVLLAFSISSKNNFNVEKPNFIIYLSDDQDFLDYNIYGNQNVQSDGVNRLAREGLVFTNFHTGQAICAPSRSQLYTGLYPLKNGSYANHTNVKSNTLTIVQHLKKIGSSIEKYKFRKASQNLMRIARIGNKYLAEEEPWKQIKLGKEERVSEIMFISLQTCAMLAILSEPFLPKTSKKLENILIKENLKNCIIP